MDVLRIVVFWSHIVLSTPLDNLAFNKSGTQSSNLHDNKWLAEAAVDGNGNQVQTGNSCACTGYYKPTVWWKVDLGNVYAVSKVKIFYRNEGTVFRLSGFKLYVTLHDDFKSNSPVYVNNNGIQTMPYPPANFTVTVEAYGQYVTLYKDRTTSCLGAFGSTNTNYCALLELCEVKVLGCSKKKYGTDCQSDCPDNCLYDVCAVSDGKCYGCKAGHTGDMCDQLCGTGTYGIGCSQTCSGNCKDGASCDVRNGTCISGCSDGYEGIVCNQTCRPGFFGSSCSSKCGSCRNDTSCNHIDGSCSNGCGLGVTGQYCKTSCSFGKYGYNCNGSCSGNCLSGATCNVQTGYCDNGCTAGWEGDTCNTVCEDGTYGGKCFHNCTGNCEKETTCSRIDGSCQYGCKSGWNGYTCDQVCKAGKFGPNCIDTCGHCMNRTSCDRQTGVCHQGCADGYRGSICNDKCKIGTYGPKCSLKCVTCNATCDHVTGICPDGNALTEIQKLQLSFIIYGIISAIIICIAVVIIMFFLRKILSLRSESNINRHDIELSVSDKSDPSNDVGVRNKTNSGDTMIVESNSSHVSKTEKYEELGHIRGEINNYETLKEDGKSTNSQGKDIKESCDRKGAKDGDRDARKYEELHTHPSENAYESLRNDDNTQYANF